jgi:hypothetical protein
MTMRRITPEQVLAAYAATGMKPARTGYDWFTEDGCGCGMTAIIKQRRPEFRNPGLIVYEAADILEVSVEYIFGFADGFDGRGRPATPAESHRTQGWEDGHAAALAVFGEAATSC